MFRVVTSIWNIVGVEESQSFLTHQKTATKSADGTKLIAKLLEQVTAFATIFVDGYRARMLKTIAALGQGEEERRKLEGPNR